MSDGLTTLERSTLLRRRTDVVWRIGDRFVVLATVDGHPLMVDGPGAEVWLRLETQQSWDDLVDSLAEDYGVHPDVVAGDLEPILVRLVAEGFVDARP